MVSYYYGQIFFSPSLNANVREDHPQWLRRQSAYPPTPLKSFWIVQLMAFRDACGEHKAIGTFPFCFHPSVVSSPSRFSRDTRDSWRIIIQQEGELVFSELLFTKQVSFCLRSLQQPLSWITQTGTGWCTLTLSVSDQWDRGHYNKI